MPDYTRFPDATDVEVLLKSSAFWPVGTPESAKVIYATEQATIGAKAAADAVSERTGYVPFLNNTLTAATWPNAVDNKTFQSTGIIKLNNGLLRLDTLNINGHVINPAHIIPMPSEAPMLHRPYSYLRLPMYRYFGYVPTYLPMQAQITGAWGFCTTVPGDLWLEVLQYAAVKTLAQVENTQSIASLSMAGLSKAWDIVGIITQKDLLGVWSKDFDAAISRYKRLVT